MDPPGHVFYVLADAPDAQALSTLMMELKFFHWNTIAIHPVQPLQQASTLLPPESA